MEQTQVLYSGKNDQMGAVDISERKKDTKRYRAIEAAMEIYKEKGYNAVTMRKVAERSKISKSLLYLYFKTKNEIFNDAIVSRIIFHNSYFADILQSLYDFRENYKQILLEKLWESFEKYYKKDKDIFNTSQYFYQSEIIHNLPEDLRNIVHKTASGVVSILQKIVKYGIDEGLFIQCDPRTLAEVIWTSFSGIIESEQTKSVLLKKSQLEVTRNFAIEILSKGILNRSH